MNREELKALLESSVENDYQIPDGYTAYGLAEVMLEYLGDTDPKLRDHLCYFSLSEWCERKFLSAEDMRKLLQTVLDARHLLCGLGQVDDTVFMRTFSALIVTSIVCQHLEAPFLQAEEVRETLERVLQFYEQDLDNRGFIDGKGWAHGAAHGADALFELAECREINVPSLQRILEAIRAKTMTGSYSFIHQEDERMVTPVTAVLERGVLSEDWLAAWVAGFGNMTKTGQTPNDMVIQVNVKQFLRSLVYRLQKPSHEGKQGAARIVTEALSVLKNIDRF